MLTLEKAKEILHRTTTDPHLLKHALAVSAAMGAMAAYYGSEPEYWEAIGYLHDVDYEQYPDAHLQHTRAMLEPEGVDEADIRCILSHGYGLCSDVKPQSVVEKCLYTVDELTGIVMAAALMRPTGISDMTVQSAKKKFKDKKFAAKCDRDVILNGCEMLGLPLDVVLSCTIAGMQRVQISLGIGPKEAE